MDDFFDHEEEEFEDIEVAELVHRYEKMIENNSSMYLSLDDYIQLFAYYMMIENDADMYSNYSEEVNMEMAASVLRYGMQQYPTSPVLQMYSIYYKYQQSEYNMPETIELVEQIEIPEYDMMNICFCKGRLYMALAASHAALPVFENLLKFAHTKGDKMDIYRELYRLIRFEHNNNIDKIIHYLEEMIKLDPSSELNYLTEIKYDYNTQEIVCAILEQYVNRHLFSKNGWMVLGENYHSYSRYEDAIDALNKAMALSNENDVTLLVYLGNAYKALGAKETAMEYYQDALQNWSPNKDYSYELLFNIAELYFEAGQLDQAAYFYNLLIEIDPESLRALHCLGMIYFAHEDYDRAIHYLERARKINMEEVQEIRAPSNDLILSLMSKCMIAVERSDEMIKIYEQMSQYAFYHIGFWLVYSEHYALIKNYVAALSILDQAMRIRETETSTIELEQGVMLFEDAPLLYRKANYYFINGDTDNGSSCLRLALIIDPSNLHHFLEYDNQMAALPEVIEIIEEFKNKK
ncbi:MAG: tetratricopeptide repeat protein [Bacteroidales bacterium]|jgi:tetratricopeptide (TPR) repeat protein|nr:tetratricopeptide repeat protein [Bacteroidales bacterium]